MKKYSGKISFMCLLALLLVLFTGTKVYAASSTVSVSSASVTSGDNVSVTVSISGDEDVAMVDLWLSYDASILEYQSGADVGGGGSIRLLSSDNTTFTIVFKAINAGTATVAVNTSQSVISSLYTDVMAISATNGSVSVKAPASYSSDNSLASLTISPGVLSPEFSKDVTTYNTSVPADCKKLVISAVTSDSAASISIWGAALDPGDNTTKITVTAEDGSQKVYVIYTKRPYEPVTQPPNSNQEPTQKPTEAAPANVLVSIAGKDYFVVSNFDESVLPEGYEAVNYDYKGNEVVVGKGLSNGLVVFYLETAADSGSEKLFFVYDEAKDEFSLLQRLNSKAMEYTILMDEAQNGPEGYIATILDLNGQQIKVWVENSPQPEYFIFYGMNVNGEKGWYQYDLHENTIQTAFILNVNKAEVKEEETAPNEQATYNDEEPSIPAESQYSNEDIHNYEDDILKLRLVIVILVFLLAAVIVILIVFVMKSFSQAGEDELSDDFDSLPHYEGDRIAFGEEDDDKEDNKEDNNKEDDNKEGANNQNDKADASVGNKQEQDNTDDDFTFIDLD